MLAPAGQDGIHVRLNGQDLNLESHDELPSLVGSPVPPGTVQLAAASISFLAVEDAGNGACR